MSGRVFRFGAYEADAQTLELRKHGRKLRLAGQPLQILLMLLHASGELVTREQIQQALWPEGTFVDFDHSLNAAVNKLRTTLSDSASNPRYVETVAKRGYRFVAPITTDDAPGVPSAPTAAPDKKDVPSGILTAPLEVPQGSRHRSARRIRAL